jgi:hypothetical protein
MFTGREMGSRNKSGRDSYRYEHREQYHIRFGFSSDNDEKKKAPA